jgi:hypothetical protein
MMGRRTATSISSASVTGYLKSPYLSRADVGAAGARGLEEEQDMYPHPLHTPGALSWGAGERTSGSTSPPTAGRSASRVPHPARFPPAHPCNPRPYPPPAAHHVLEAWRRGRVDMWTARLCAVVVVLGRGGEMESWV